MAERNDPQSPIQRILATFVALIVGLLGLSAIQQKSPDAATGNEKELRKGADKAPQEKDAKNETPPELVPLARFLGLEDWRRTGASQIKKELDKTGLFLEVVVATLPDPDAISYGNYTNQIVESILRAAEAAGYSYDRHWLPWSGEPPEDDVRNFRPRGGGPGVVIFRREKTLLLVFLVGETPTAGIETDQFRIAREHASKLIGRGLGGLRVLGPTYSGSALSLIRALQTAPPPGPRVVSGTVTVEQATTAFQQNNIDFTSLARSDRKAKNALLDYYQQLYGGRSGKALMTTLSESGSDYGAGNRVVSKKPCKSPSVNFPMSISRVRIAYQADEALRELGAAQKKEVGRNRLQLRLEEQKAAGYDKIPDYGGGLTPYSQELALERVVNQIAQCQPRLLSLFASDIRDILFLGSYLQFHYPQTRLVLFDSDVLYTNRSSFSFDGALSVSSFPDEDLATGYAFPNMTAQGVFHAMEALLAPDGTSKQPTNDIPSWLSVYGHGRSWPLAVLAADPKPRNEWKEAIARRIETGRRGRFYLACLLLIAAVLLAWWSTLPAAMDGFTAALYQTMPGALAVMLGAFGGVAWMARDWASLALALAGVGATAFAMAQIGWRAASAWHWPVAAAAAAGTYVGFQIPRWLESLEGAHLAGSYYAYRAVPLGSGVSPLCPLLLLAGVPMLGAWTQLRARTLAQWAAREPGFHREWRWASRIGAAWIAASVVLLELTYIDTVEGRHYNRLFAALMGAAYWFTAFAMVRLIELQLHSSRILGDLERDHARKSFKPVPGDSKFWTGPGRQTFELRRIQLEQAEPESRAPLEWALTLETLTAAARRQLYFLSVAVIMLMGAFQWYPFQPAVKFIRYVGGTLLVCGGLGFAMFIRVERLHARSPLYFAADKGGHFSWENTIKLVTTLAAPVLFVVGAFFPHFGRDMDRWTTPLLSFLK